MSGSAILAIKMAARRAVHDRASFAAVYENGDVTLTLNVRWHGRSLVQGNEPDNAFAEVLESRDIIVFDLDELAAKGVTLKRNDVVTMPAVMGGGQFSLEADEPIDGPVNCRWVVAAL